MSEENQNNQPTQLNPLAQFFLPDVPAPAAVVDHAEQIPQRIAVPDSAVVDSAKVAAGHGVDQFGNQWVLALLTIPNHFDRSICQVVPSSPAVAVPIYALAGESGELRHWSLEPPQWRETPNWCEQNQE